MARKPKVVGFESPVFIRADQRSLQKLQRKMRKFPQKAQRGVIRSAVTAGGQVVLSAARKLAPKGTWSCLVGSCECSASTALIASGLR